MYINIGEQMAYGANLTSSQINEPVCQYGHKENLDGVDEWFVLL